MSYEGYFILRRLKIPFSLVASWSCSVRTATCAVLSASFVCVSASWENLVRQTVTSSQITKLGKGRHPHTHTVTTLYQRIEASYYNTLDVLSSCCCIMASLRAERSEFAWSRSDVTCWSRLFNWPASPLTFVSSSSKAGSAVVGVA